MMRKPSTTWEEDTAHAAKVGMGVLALAIFLLAIWPPIEVPRTVDAEQTEASR